MKKILFVAVAMLSIVSCLEGSYSNSYSADITFEFAESVYEVNFKDSVYLGDKGEGFLYMNYPLLFGQKFENGTFRGGFAMSCLKGEKDGELVRPAADNDAYRVHAASGAKESRTYAVFYDNGMPSMMPEHDIEFGGKEIGSCTPVGCYVNNTTLVARKIREHFVENDKLVLKAVGYRNDGTKTEMSIVLADAAKDTVMYNWTVFNLSKLGPVDYVDFEVQSTNPEVPGSFCLDGYLANIKIEY